MRQQNNISPVGSGGSAADSYSSDSTASLSSGSLQECLQDTLQDGLPVDRVQQPTQDTTPTASSSSSNNNSNNSNQLNERVTTVQQVTKQQHQTPKQHQQTVKPPQQSPQQSKQPNLKQSSPSKNQLSVYDVKHKQPKQQPQQQEESRRQTSPKHQQAQIKQEPSVSGQTTPVTLTSTPVTQSHHQNNTNRMETKISPKAIKLEPSTYSPPEQNSHQEQLPEDKTPNKFELLQRPKQEENNLITGGKQKIHIKKEVVDEEIMKDKENEISKVSSQERRVNAVRKANLRYSKLEVNTSHENAESNTDSCADSIHSNCSSSPDVNETGKVIQSFVTDHEYEIGHILLETNVSITCVIYILISCNFQTILVRYIFKEKKIIYSNHKISTDKINFFFSCIFRWGIMGLDNMSLFKTIRWTTNDWMFWMFYMDSFILCKNPKVKHPRNLCVPAV